VTRPLPYLIGSHSFHQEDDVGVGDLLSEGKLCWWLKCGHEMMLRNTGKLIISLNPSKLKSVIF